VLSVDEIAGVGLQPAGILFPIHVAGRTVEEQVAVVFRLPSYRSEMHTAIAGKSGDLENQIARRFLIGHNAV